MKNSKITRNSLTWNKTTKHSVFEVLTYFSFFDYPPTFDEIYTFLKNRASKSHLNSILDKMMKKSLIITSSFVKTSENKERIQRYTLGEYGIYNKLKITNEELRIKFQGKIRNPQYVIKNYLIIERISRKKIKKVEKYINFLSIFPQIKLVGLSGSVAMLNAQEQDDVDLFVITAKNRLWTGRFITLLLAQLLGLRRRRKDPTSSRLRGARDKVCLNLFFDEKNLRVPVIKKTEYVAHEILQMKPLEQKKGVYLRFIDVNRWVFDIFPNANSKVKSQKSKSQFKSKNFLILTFIFNFLLLPFDLFELILKHFQLYFIRKHQTSEIITPSQLWFHPQDFGEKIKLAHPTGV